MKRQLILPLICVAMLGFAVYHVVNAQQQPAKAPPPNEPSRTPFRGAIAGGGVVESRSENIAIGSHLPGVVAEVLVKVDDRVEGPSWLGRGTPLFRLDDRQLRSELHVRQAALISAKATLARLESMPRTEEVPPLEARVRESEALLNDARDQYVRSQQLLKNRAVGEEEVIRRRNAVAVAEAQLAKSDAELKLLKTGAWQFEKEIARANVSQAEQLVKQTMTEIERLTVYAPITGTILQRNVRPGEYVGVPPGQALLVIGDVDVLHIRVDIDESDLPRFRPGIDGRATPRGSPGTEIPLTFVRVEPLVVPKRSLTGSGSERVDTRVLPVIYAAKSSAMKLYVGQQLDVYLEVK
ncbi:MAG: efflux RND transporter periplasmic adaptor subunit [Planctomycetes bacterium]|nr:efflux RND transporter periplasmic adaptor subunit [Planctomycetota bacterium]